jgi:adenosylcobinamide-GDP ribazoletransferase
MNQYFKALLLAIQFLTRIPVPVDIEPDQQLTRRSLYMFPLVGWLIGGILYLLCIFIMMPGKFSPLTVAVILVTVETLITGAFHLDGLADTFDAFFSTAQTPGQKLEIMKDSRIGVMGAAALMLALLLKITIISECLRYNLKGVVAIYPAMGRLAQVALYSTSPYIRSGGIGLLFSQAATGKILWQAAAFVLPSLLLQTPLLLVAYGLFAGFITCYKYYAEQQIGGITGDVLGSATVLSEIVFMGSFLVGLLIEWFFLQAAVLLTA